VLFQIGDPLGIVDLPVGTDLVGVGGPVLGDVDRDPG
jgi:hypothetical protein